MTHLLQWVALAAEAARGAVAKLVDERTAAHLREVSDPRRRVQPRGQRLQRLARRLRLQPRVQGRLQLLRHGERARTDTPRQLLDLLLCNWRRRVARYLYWAIDGGLHPGEMDLSMLVKCHRQQSCSMRSRDILERLFDFFVHMSSDEMPYAPSLTRH